MSGTTATSKPWDNVKLTAAERKAAREKRSKGEAKAYESAQQLARREEKEQATKRAEVILEEVRTAVKSDDKATSLPSGATSVFLAGPDKPATIISVIVAVTRRHCDKVKVTIMMALEMKEKKDKNGVTTSLPYYTNFTLVTADGKQLSLMASKKDIDDSVKAKNALKLELDRLKEAVETGAATNPELEAKHKDVNRLRKEHRRLQMLVDYLPDAVMEQIGWGHESHPESRYFLKRPGKVQINENKARFGWHHTPGIAAQRAIGQDHRIPLADGEPMVFRFSPRATELRNPRGKIVQIQSSPPTDPIITPQHVRSLLQAGADHGRESVKTNCKDTLAIITRNDLKITVIAGIHSADANPAAGAAKNRPGAPHITIALSANHMESSEIDAPGWGDGLKGPKKVGKRMGTTLHIYLSKADQCSTGSSQVSIRPAPSENNCSTLNAAVTEVCHAGEQQMYDKEETEKMKKKNEKDGAMVTEVKLKWVKQPPEKVKDPMKTARSPNKVARTYLDGVRGPLRTTIKKQHDLIVTMERHVQNHNHDGDKDVRRCRALLDALESKSGRLIQGDGANVSNQEVLAAQSANSNLLFATRQVWDRREMLWPGASSSHCVEHQHESVNSDWKIATNEAPSDPQKSQKMIDLEQEIAMTRHQIAERQCYLATPKEPMQRGLQHVTVHGESMTAAAAASTPATLPTTPAMLALSAANTAKPDNAKVASGTSANPSKPTLDHGKTTYASANCRKCHLPGCGSACCGSTSPAAVGDNINRLPENSARSHFLGMAPVVELAAVDQLEQPLTMFMQGVGITRMSGIDDCMALAAEHGIETPDDFGLFDAKDLQDLGFKAGDARKILRALVGVARS